MLKNHWPLRLFLLFAPGLLAEVLSGNTPIMKLFNPVDLFFLVLAYGVPILLIWEYKVKYSLSFFSVFLLGLAYGIFNEGLIAKTILDTSTVPFGGFQSYPSFIGLNLAWVIFIIPWHAFYSVLFPIAFAHAFFREENTVSLIGNRWKYVFLFVTFIFLPFIGKEWQGSISPGLYILFYGTITALIILSRYVLRFSISPSSRRGFSYGLLTLFPTLFLFIAPGKMPLWLYALLALACYVLILRFFFPLSTPERAKFALGVYIAFGGFAMLISIFAGRVDLIVMYLLFMGILYFWLKKKGYF